MRFIINYFHEVLQIVGDDRKKLPKFVVLFLLLSALDLLGLGLIAPFIAATLDSASMPTRLVDFLGFFVGDASHSQYLLACGLLLITIFISKMFFAVLVQYSIIGFGEAQKTKLRLVLLRQYQEMDYQEFKSRNSSDYIFMLQDVTVRFARIVVNLLKAISDLFLVTCIFIFLLSYDTETVLILIAVSFGLLFSYDRVFRRILHRRGIEANSTGIAVINALRESITGFKEIRVLGREDYFYAEMKKNADRYAESYTVVQTVGVAPRYTFESAAVIFIVAIVGVAVLRQKDMVDYLPTLGVFALAVIRVIPPISQVASTISNMHFNIDALQRMRADIPNRLPLPATVASLDSQESDNFVSLELKNASFRHRNATANSLDNVSIKVAKGEAIGIIGQSGSGKTTTMDLMLGLLQPCSGEVLMNNQPLAQADFWNKTAAYIPQESLLTSNSLAENVALGVSKDLIDVDRVIDSLGKASLSQLVTSLPNGLETELGDSGLRLSGGQRQRVLLARALYHKREIIFLDEATSALDEQIERDIIDELARSKGDLTFVLIAHRLNTLRFCDRIYKLEDGAVVKAGPAMTIIAEEKSS